MNPMHGARETAEYLDASFRLSGAAFADSASSASRALPWFRHLQAFGFESVPFFVVHDVGHLLLSGDEFPFRAVRDLDRWSEPERPPRLAYENRFLNGLRTDPRFRRLGSELLLTNSARNRLEMGSDPMSNAVFDDAVLQRALEILFAPLRDVPLETVPPLNPVLLREVDPFRGANPDRPGPVGEEPSDVLAPLEEFLSKHAPLLELSRSLGEEDFFELRHFEALGRPHRRLFARRVQELVTAAGPIDLGRTRLRVETNETLSLVTDEGTYPTGGIGEITRHGSIENLVRTELVYRDAHPDVDLFALRWAEGDLLFYTRDSGSLQRKRRSLVFALEPERLRTKAPGHAVSLAVLFYSLIARISDDLLELFGGEGARVELRLVSHKEVEADREEMDLFALRMREALRRGVAGVSRHPSLDPRALIDPRRESYIVALEDTPLDEAEIARLGGTVLHVRFSKDAAPASSKRGDTFFLDPASRETGREIAKLRDAMLTRVLGVS